MNLLVVLDSVSFYHGKSPSNHLPMRYQRYLQEARRKSYLVIELPCMNFLVVLDLLKFKAIFYGLGSHGIHHHQGLSFWENISGSLFPHRV